MGAIRMLPIGQQARGTIGGLMDTDWTDQIITRMVSMFNAGKTTQQICDAFDGRFNRSQITGKIYRLRQTTTLITREAVQQCPTRQTFWSAERKAELTRMFEAGLSDTAIG